MTVLNGRPGNDPRPQTPEDCPVLGDDPLSNLRTELRKKFRYRTDEAAEYLLAVFGVTVAVATLRKKRTTGGGPEAQTFGRAVLYHRSALDAWAHANLSDPKSSTSEL
jgi:hypothetical protein